MYVGALFSSSRTRLGLAPVETSSRRLLTTSPPRACTERSISSSYLWDPLVMVAVVRRHCLQPCRWRRDYVQRPAVHIILKGTMCCGQFRGSLWPCFEVRLQSHGIQQYAQEFHLLLSTLQRGFLPALPADCLGFPPT